MCPYDNHGTCTNMICLEDTECGSRDSKGAPKYDYLNSVPVEKKKHLTK